MKLETCYITNSKSIFCFTELNLPFLRSAVVKEDFPEDSTRDMVESQQVLRTNLFRYFDLQRRNSLSSIHFQRYCHLSSTYSESSAKHMWCDQSFLSEAKFESSTQISKDSVKTGEPVDMGTSPYSELKDLYLHFKTASSFSAGATENLPCDLTKISHEILKDTFGYFNSCSDTRKEYDSKAPSFVKFSDEMYDKNKLNNISVSDCVYNQNGQLVRMFLCFDFEHSDTSSVVSSSDSGCKDWESDCEDFIVFENSCADESNCCTMFEFECESSELHQETFVKSVVLSSNLYCEVSVMDSFDNKLDSFVQEMQQPHLYYSCEELILNKKTSKEMDTKDSADFISRSATNKAVSQVKRKKKVCFKPENELAVVHPMVVWSFAYRQARKGTWEADASDRLRFKKRIEELDEILTPVLLAKMEEVI